MAYTPPPIEGATIDQGELDAAFVYLRNEMNATEVGRLISDDTIRSYAVGVVAAIEAYRSGKPV